MPAHGHSRPYSASALGQPNLEVTLLNSEKAKDKQSVQEQVSLLVCESKPVS